MDWKRELPFSLSFPLRPGAWLFVCDDDGKPDGGTGAVRRPDENTGGSMAWRPAGGTGRARLPTERAGGGIRAWRPAGGTGRAWLPAERAGGGMA